MTEKRPCAHADLAYVLSAFGQALHHQYGDTAEVELARSALRITEYLCTEGKYRWLDHQYGGVDAEAFKGACMALFEKVRERTIARATGA